MPIPRIAALAAVVLLAAPLARGAAQDSIPAAVAALARSDLEAGQKTLKELGYQVVNAEFFGQEQTWRNPKSASCVSLKLDGSTITAVTPVPAAKCREYGDAARRAAVGVANGEADMHSASVDAERRRLASEGYQVRWSHLSFTPDTGAEWWLNPASNSCMVVSWSRKTGEALKTRKAEKVSYCENPYF